MANKLPPIYSCANESGVAPGKYVGHWMNDEIDFVIGDQPIKIKTHGKGQQPPVPVLILIFPHKVLVWNGNDLK